MAESRPRVECDAVGCRDLADYHLVGVWSVSDEEIQLYVCLVHMAWGIKELQAYRIAGLPPNHVRQYVVDPALS